MLTAWILLLGLFAGYLSEVLAAVQLGLALLCVVVAAMTFRQHRFAMMTAATVAAIAIGFAAWWIAGPGQLDEGMIGVVLLAAGAVLASAANRRQIPRATGERHGQR